MRKREIILFGLFVGIFIIAFVGAACTPDYQCGEWGVCSGEVQSRECIDRTCGGDNITERKLCDNDCKPNIICEDWGSCVYTSSGENLFAGTFEFKGMEIRQCVDVNSCVESFEETRVCVESSPVRFVKKEVCGKMVTSVLDEKSGKTVAIVDAEKKTNRKIVSISFIEEKYECIWCSNGVRDGDEQGIDCGGSCKKCVQKNTISYDYLRNGLWAFSVIMAIMFCFVIFLVYRKSF